MKPIVQLLIVASFCVPLKSAEAAWAGFRMWNYCGHRYEGYPDKSKLRNGKPQNDLDAICKAHDLCVIRFAGNSDCGCDQKFFTSIDRYIQNGGTNTFWARFFVTALKTVGCKRH